METTVASKMTFDMYQQEALRTAAETGNGREGQALGTVGLAGESSELLELFLDAQESFIKAIRTSVLAGKAADYMKKVLFHGHTLDKERVKKELGDVLWYCAVLAHACGLSFADVAEANVAKLRARFPNGFDSNLSQNRKAGDV